MRAIQNNQDKACMISRLSLIVLACRCCLQVRVYLTKLCRTEAEEAELTAALQQALKSVLQDAALADKVDTAAAVTAAVDAEAAVEAPAAAAAAAEEEEEEEEEEEKELCDSEEGEELWTQPLPAADRDAEVDNEEEADQPQGMDMDTAAAPADVCSTPPPAAAADMLPNDEEWQQLNSQVAEMSQLPCTQAPTAASRSLPRWASVTPCSQLGSQMAETLQQQQQQQMLPFGMQTEQRVLAVGQSAGEGGVLHPDGRLEPAASSCIGTAAAAADVVDLTAAEEAEQAGQQSHDNAVKWFQKQFLGAQKGQDGNPSKRAAGSRPQAQVQGSKRPKTTTTKQH
jgi:hypothetical protein